MRLVDGGVHDNQGIAGLLEQDCTVLLVSDASGQLRTEATPSNNVLGVPLRSNGILMARVREAEYRELAARRRSSLLSGLMYIHLRKEISVNPVDWKYCKDPYTASDEYKEMPGAGNPLTSYGVSKKVQALLSLIRTDLDSFSEVEAYALMLSGYKMTQYEYKERIKSIPTREKKENWEFLNVDDLLKERGSEKMQEEFLRQLKVGQKRGFRIWHLNTGLGLAGTTLKIIGILALVLLIVPPILKRNINPTRLPEWAKTLFTYVPDSLPLYVLSVIVVALLLLFLLPVVLERFGLRRMRGAELMVIRILTGLVVGPIMCLGAGLHLLIFNRLFLNRGSLSYMQGLKGKAG